MNRVAIIDDSDINLLLLSALVGKLGDCESINFQESTKGLAWCSGNTPDLIIVDYMMPEMDGIQFISRLRAMAGKNDVPILMITANDDKYVRYEAL
jgi:CheY-like chemotaxis protein